MNHHFKLLHEDTEYLTRAQGVRVRAKLETLVNGLAQDDRLVIDFEGVQVMTPSFADECFGKLAQGMGFATFRQRITLIGANETNRILVNAILAERSSASSSVNALSR